jgi:hypothetical protein
MHSRCSGTNREGGPCNAELRPGRPWCRWHDPLLEAERAVWRRKGGTARSNRSRAKRQLAEGALTPADVHALLCVTLKGVVAGKITPGIGQAAAALARAITDVGRAAEISERLDELERRQNELRGAS